MPEGNELNRLSKQWESEMLTGVPVGTIRGLMLLVLFVMALALALASPIRGAMWTTRMLGIRIKQR